MSDTTILPPPRRSAPPVLTDWEIERIARSSAWEAFAWACCIGFIGGLGSAYILLSW